MNKNETPIKSWEQLQSLLFEDKDEDLDRFRSRFVYRGMHNKAYGLETSLQRIGRKPSECEGHILRNFKKYTSINTFSDAQDNVWSWLALGQHYGLPTRLLDWSFSPHVALHFMADYDKGFDHDGVIWMVDFIELNKRLPQKLDDKVNNSKILTFMPDELSKLVGKDLEQIGAFEEEHGDCLLFMEAPSFDDRIVNQFALFSTMLNPDNSVLTYLENYPDLYRKLIIPAELKWEIRDKLDQANISERIIYPGLEGISKWLKRWYAEKNPDKSWKLDS